MEPFTAVANSSGVITIQFVTVVDNAKLSGLEILAAARCRLYQLI